MYGKFLFSSNTLAVQTPKIILKLLLKTFSFSSNSDYFHAFEFLILWTLKNARNNAWTSQPCQIFGCFVFPPTPWAKRGNSIVSMYGVLLGLKVICGQEKFFWRFDVSSFWENQLKKEVTFISEIKNKIRRIGMRNIYPVFQPPASQFLHRVYNDLRTSTL